MVTDLANYDDARARDEDDILGLAVMLLLADAYDIVGVTVGAAPDPACVGAKQWAEANVATAYASDWTRLRHLGGFQSQLSFFQSAMCRRTFDLAATYDLRDMDSVGRLVEAIEAGPLYVLAWGELGEVAVAIKHLLTANAIAALAHATIVSHWTYPFDESNCKNDVEACAYLHELAEMGILKFYELGPMGERGLTKCNNGGKMPVSVFESNLGRLLEHKWNLGSPDFSDGATNLVVQGYAGGLADLESDGSYDAAGIDRMCADRPAIYAKIVDRAQVAAGREPTGTGGASGTGGAVGNGGASGSGGSLGAGGAGGSAGASGPGPGHDVGGTAGDAGSAMAGGGAEGGDAAPAPGEASAGRGGQAGSVPGNGGGGDQGGVPIDGGAQIGGHSASDPDHDLHAGKRGGCSYAPAGPASTGPWLLLLPWWLRRRTKGALRLGAMLVAIATFACSTSHDAVEVGGQPPENDAQLDRADAGAAGGSQGADLGPHTPMKACNGAFANERTIVVEPVADTAVNDFPLLVALDGSLFAGARLQERGEDVRFFGQEGEMLAHEIDTWDPQGTSFAWVRLPSLPARGTSLSLKLCSGSSSPPPQQNPWPSRSLVMHFSDGLADSSPRSYQATFGPPERQPGFEDGQLGRALTLGGRETLERVHLPGIDSPGGGLDVLGGASSFTILIAAKNRNGNAKAWLFSFSPDQEFRIDGKKLFGDPNPSHHMVTLYTNHRNLSFYSRTAGYQVEIWRDTVSGIEAGTDSGTLPANDWHFLVTTVDLEAETVTFFVDGQKLQSIYGHVDLFRKGYPEGIVPDMAAIGSYAPGGAGHYKGAIDEFRFLRGTVSDEWVKNAHANLSDPRAFARLDSNEAPSEP